MLDLHETLAELHYTPQWAPTVWHRVSTPPKQAETRLLLGREFSAVKRLGATQKNHLKESQTTEIRRRVLAGEKMARVAKAMGVHRSTVTRIMQAAA